MNRLLDWGKRTYVMGILNITPDSFSGDGLFGLDEPVKLAVKGRHPCRSALIQQDHCQNSDADRVDLNIQCVLHPNPPRPVFLRAEKIRGRMPPVFSRRNQEKCFVIARY